MVSPIRVFRRRLRVTAACLVGILILAYFGYQGRAKSPRFVFLYVRETNNSLLGESPVGPVEGEFPVWSPDPPELSVAGSAPPPANTKLIVLHDIEAFDILVQSRLCYASAPVDLAFDAPASWQNEARDGQGALAGRIALNNTGRLVPASMSIESILDDGTVSVELDGDLFSLGPGEGWRVARGIVDGRLRSVVPGPAWDQFVQDQLAENRPLTVFSVYNYGWWPRTALVEKVR